MTRPVRLLIALALLALPATASASEKAKTLGPAPKLADCLAWHSTTQGCYYDVGGIEFTLSSHIVHVGDKVTGTTAWNGGFPWGWEGAPPGTKVVECTPDGADGGGTCQYEATASSGGWRPGPEASGRGASSGVFFGSAIYCCTIGTYIDGDYLAVIGGDDEAISGFTRDREGAATPGTVFIAGKTAKGKEVDVYADADDSGFYDALLEKGDYSVRAYQSGGRPMCVASITTYCRKQAKVSPTTTVDWREDVNARIVGKVTSQQTGKPLANVALAVKDAIGGDVASAVTNGEGEYAVDLEKSGLYTVTSAKPDSGLTPSTTDVDAKLGEEKRADFTVDSGLKLTLDAPAWHPGDDFFTANLTIENTGKSKLSNLEFAQNNPLIISTAGYPQDGGGLQLLGAIAQSNKTTLDPGEQTGITFGLQATAPGRVAVFSKAYATNAAGDRESDGHTLRVTVSDHPFGKGTANELKMDAAETLATNAQSSVYEASQAAGRKLYDQGRKALSPAEEKQWYGATDKLKITGYERAIASQRGVAPELVAASLPNKPVTYQGETYTAEELNAVHDSTFFKEVGNGVKNYASDVAGGLTAAAKGAWSDAVLTGRYMMGSASAEERLQWEATMTAMADINDSAFGTINRESSDPNTFRYAGQAIAATFDDVTLRSADLQAAISQDVVLEGNLGKLADADPRAYQRAMAENDASWVNATVPTLMNTIVGGVTQRVGGAVWKRVAGATATGEKAAAGLTVPAEGGASGYEIAAVRAEGGIAKTGQSLAEVSAAGGLPESNITQIQSHLKTIEGEIAERFGVQEEIGAGMKPLNGTPKAGAVPKLELLKTKNGLELDLELGMPKAGLNEPVYYKPNHPRKLAYWDDLPAARRKALLERYESKMGEWADYQAEIPSKDTAKLQKLIGQRGEYDLGLGRKAVGEFEEHAIGDNAFTVRVKHYEVVNPGQKKGTVFVNSEKPLPMTNDPDGVALFSAKTGERMSRQVENYATLRLRQLVAKDIQNGVGSVAEHGFTLIMDDAGAKAAGKLVQHGAKFLNETTAREWLGRIAPFTGRTVEEMLGGTTKFGQEVTVITSSDAFFGELPITSW